MSEAGPRADAVGFVVIYPQGVGDPVGWNTTLGSADLAYIGHVLDRVEDDLCVDRRRVFAAGLSMGAFMSSSIACQYAYGSWRWRSSPGYATPADAHRAGPSPR